LTEKKQFVSARSCQKWHST